MGLATSQVRLLALTSRKADVEMQIQLNSKRKTMLTRESSELAKLYYAKLQASKIQYSTGNGYKDVTYGYLMAQDTASFFDQIINPNTNSSIEKKSCNSMILTDNYGRVILNDTMLDAVLAALNSDGQEATKNNRTVKSLTIDAMKVFLEKMGSSDSTGLVPSGNAKGMSTQFNDLYNNTNPQIGYDILASLYTNGAPDGGIIFKGTDGKFYSNSTCSADNEVTPEAGTFYIAKDSNGGFISSMIGSMYWPGCSEGGDDFYIPLDKSTAADIARMFDFYGNIFSAAFNGSQTLKDSDNSTHTEAHFNVAVLDGDIVYDTTKKQYVKNGNSKYDTVTNTDNLQAGLKSGIYQLVNVSSKETGGYSKAQGLAYFESLNYVTEKADTSERESVTAWYNAAKADLSEKESYWDTEITALSSELNIINTEIESVKTLRKDAIDSTFKWGSA